jgi:glutathione synthase
MALGLCRSDYLMHQPLDKPGAPLELKQVEFNTISSSFGALGTKVAEMHKLVFCLYAFPSE